MTGLSKAHIIALKYLLVCLGPRKVSLKSQIFCSSSSGGSTTSSGTGTGTVGVEQAIGGTSFG